MNRRLILASSSIYRRNLLERLHLPFETISPEIDETPHAGELPIPMVKRLSRDKAMALHKLAGNALIIGSDQCVVLGHRIIGKPKKHENARMQLRAASGQRVAVHTGVCLLDTATNVHWVDVVSYDIAFRELDEAEIERYLLTERPYDCAGSVKSEGLGVSLLRHMRGDDPSALIGLPLIRLCEMLRVAGIQIPPN